MLRVKLLHRYSLTILTRCILVAIKIETSMINNCNSQEFIMFTKHGWVDFGTTEGEHSAIFEPDVN